MGYRPVFVALSALYWDGGARILDKPLFAKQPKLRKIYAILPMVQSLLANNSDMMTLLVLGAIWMALSLVFCLGLCVAAAKPLPKTEAGKELADLKPPTMKTVDEDALCIR